MTRTLTYLIQQEDEGKKIWEYLREKGFSRHVLRVLKEENNGLLRNGEAAFASSRMREGDVLTINLTEKNSSQEIEAVPMDLNIVYEDEDLLIVDKPADTPIHPSPNNYGNTLANGIAYYYRSRGLSFVYRCINRLDRDTTGLLIVAKNMLSGAILSDMITKRGISREYLAIATGEVSEEGVIDAPIGRKENSVIQRCVDFEKGDRSVTKYRRLEYKKGYSLVSLKLETGRTHQIRIHMKYIGCPLIGDYLYNPDYRLLSHQALHSHKLEFLHPVTGEEMKFTSEPPWMQMWRQI